MEALWESSVRTPLLRAAELVSAFGYDRRTLVTDRALIPLAYYLIARKATSNVVSARLRRRHGMIRALRLVTCDGGASVFFFFLGRRSTPALIEHGACLLGCASPLSKALGRSGLERSHCRFAQRRDRKLMASAAIDAPSALIVEMSCESKASTWSIAAGLLCCT